jgi:hypothetical protein
MRNLSSAWKEKARNGMDVNYLKYADITLKDGTVLNLTNKDFWENGMEFEDSVSSDESFDIGSAIINKLTLTINNFDGQYSEYDFEDASVICYVGLETESKKKEKKRICTMMVVEQPEDETVTIGLVCEDNMRKFDKDYSLSKLKYPATRAQIVRDACSVCGVTLQTQIFDRSDYIVQVRPSDEALTFRQVLQWVAQIGCQWMRCDEYGRLCIGWYKSINEGTLVLDENGVLISPDRDIIIANETASVENGSFIECNGVLKLFLVDKDGNISQMPPTYSFTPQHTDVVITGVRVTEYSDSLDDDAASYISGKEGYVLDISENKLIGKGDGETVAAMIAEKCVGMLFRPFEAECVTDVSLEAGDSVVIVDRNGKTYTSFVTSTVLSPGNGQSIACNAKSAAKNSSVQYSQETQAFVAARNMIKKEKSERERVLKEFKERMDKATGLYSTIEVQEDGSKIYYLHDKPTLAESQAVWKMTAEAWGVSTDGGQTWNGGMTVDGDTIVRILNAVGINADWINAGSILVKDKSGNIIFKADMDTGTVTLDGSCVTIGGKPLDEKIEDVENMAALARNMTMQLDNDYQGIPVDSDGNYTEFPECTTTATVMYGTQDITDNCTYTITTSQNIQGNWNGESKTYTVAGLTADSGWVDIRAVYLNNLAVTKRFSIAKQYAGVQGEPGTPGRTYFLRANTELLLMGADKKISPATLTVSAFYRDGQEEEKNLYGYWKVEKSSDGGNSYSEISTAYTTSMKMINVAVNTMSLAAHDMLRVSVYSDAEKTILCDRQSFSVAIDVAALTQEQIVDILSDGGKFKGLYYGKDESGNQTLYISFNAAKGGTLALGGVNDGNGQLKVYDANGKEVIRLTNGGMALNNIDSAGNAITIFRLIRSGLYYYDETGKKRKITLSTAGMALYTDYTDANNYKALRFGKYGLYAVKKDSSVEELWMEGDTSHTWDGYIIRYLENAVRVNANAVYTDGCSMGKNLKTEGMLYFPDWENQSAKSPVYRLPIASASNDGSKVAYIGAGQTYSETTDIGDLYSPYLSVRGQFAGNSSYVTSKFYSGAAPSDIRLKENVKDSKVEALETVNKMKVRQFDWKKGGHQNIGFVADELEEIDPNLALGGGYDENGEMDVKQINTSYLLNYAIKAIQELSATVKEQGRKIRELEEKLDGIKGN